MRTLLRALLICVLAPAAVALAQENPLSAYNKVIYAGVKGILLRSAEKMPEESYSFRPTDAVRSYGQIVGHVADAQYLFCSLVLGEKNPSPKIEQTKTSKADLIAALKDAFAYCDKAYDGMTDASADSNGDALRRRHTEARRAGRQQHAHHGTLRQPRHLHADEEHRSSHQRAETPAPAPTTTEEMMGLRAGRWSALTSLANRPAATRPLFASRQGLIG